MMNGNAWLGANMLKRDPNKQNKNGELFQNFLLRNPHLTLLNNESICEGLITRMRSVNNKTEKSVIDFVFVCDIVIPYVTKLLVDEQKIFPLANFSSKKKIKYSDHNSLLMEMNIKHEHF